MQLSSRVVRRIIRETLESSSASNLVSLDTYRKQLMDLPASKQDHANSSSSKLPLFLVTNNQGKAIAAGFNKDKTILDALETLGLTVTEV